MTTAPTRQPMTDVMRDAYESIADTGWESAYELFEIAWQAATLAERERCALVCDDVSSNARREYKTSTAPGARYSPHLDGVSDGASDCADTIRQGGAL